MRENFLHYVWKLKKFQINNLKTTAGAEVLISKVGEHNFNTGPDFFNAQLKIDGQLWAGNVEIHVNSSDWFLHNHERDKAYDNVILHVVWEHDIDVFRKDNTVIPTLQLKDFVLPKMIKKYKQLFSKERKWINCENEFASIDSFILSNWLERLYFERLESKSKLIEQLLAESKNDWERVLFIMLTKNFGLKVNGEAFFSLAKSFDFAIIRKLQRNQNQLEALLIGQANLLESPVEDGYYRNLVKEFRFMKQKFNLDNQQVLPIQFFRLRPLNFPTIRLSQLAGLYHQHQNLFSKIMALESIDDFYEVFKISTSTYWNTHYTFQKTSRKSSKKYLSKSFIDLILVNTIIPIRFLYNKQKGAHSDSSILKLASQIKSEENHIIDAFNKLKKVSKTSMDSQALIQLKKAYCDKNNCLKCVVGNQLLSE
ncbi:DUF2851 family protein [Algibacter mikhailovii]|uniref:DUF2851 family protein n=1 Tax=Algibacter mikhailovii TaxID=425498 RepID=UPI0024947997|nr:DUF2851 family protein [Algibacter mikhailovii]